MATKATKRRQANERQWLAALYKKWTVQEEQADVNYVRLAEDIGASSASFLKATHIYRELGILITRLTYDRGRHSFWTLAVPQDEAMQRLAEYHAGEETRVTTPKPKPEPKPEPVSELVASVGGNAESPFTPLASLRKDDQEALIAAARQYASRKTMLTEMLGQLERAGITANTDAFNFTYDERLESIALVLPAIDRRQRQIEALEDRIQRYADQARPREQRIEDLEREIRGLRRIVERYTAGEPVGAIAGEPVGAK